MRTPLWIALIVMGACGVLAACGEPREKGAPEAANAAGQVSARLHRAGPGAIQDRYIVILEDAGQRELHALAQGHGASVRHVYSRALKGFSATMTEAQALRMSEDPRVRYIEQERVLTLSGTQVRAPWNLDHLDQRGPPYDELYTYENMGESVHAYLLDTGLRAAHTEFTGRVGNGFTAIADGRGTGDCSGHGTHVAGVLGGTFYGVAKGVTLHPVRAFDCSSQGTLETVLAGIDWITANHVKPAVVNMSFGSQASQALDDAVAQSLAAGIVYVVAAGNDNTDACLKSPARLPQVLTVGASSPLNARATFSNYGRCVDLFAHGESITSAAIGSDTSTLTASGTSVAAAHVSGAVAIYLQVHPTATPAEVHEELVLRSTYGGIQMPGPGSPSVMLHSACMGSGDLVKPQVTLIDPLEGATLSDMVTFEAAASDEEGISRVDFFLDGRFFYSATQPPYGSYWNTAWRSNGPHTFSARAFDTRCNSVTSSISLTLQNPGNAVYDPALGVPRCAEVGSECSSAELLEGRAGFGPEPHAPNTLNASCPDGTGEESSSRPNTSVERLRVFREDGGLLTTGRQVGIEVTFSAIHVAEQRVDLYSAPNALSPVWTFIASITPQLSESTVTVPFTLPEGELQAIRGVFWRGGTPGPCVPGSLNDHDDLVFAVLKGPDVIPPTATLTAPAAGATLKGIVSLAATASDNFAVTRVEFYDGNTLLGTDTDPPYSFSWDTRPADNGTHVLTAKAYDAVGQSGTSPGVSVTLDNDQVLPTVAFSAPAAGATVMGSVTVTATASDNVGVTRVEFHDGETLLWTDTTSPYSFMWDTRTALNGTRPLTAKAYDAMGNTGVAEMMVTVNNDVTAPTVMLTAPAEGGTLTGMVAFSATASDDRAVSRVTFFVGTTQVGSDTTAPYSFNYNTRNLPNGPKVLTVRAYDAVNNVGTSAPVNVTFENDFTPPTVTLTAPAEGETLTGTVVLSATASDLQGVSKVVFFVGTTQVGTDTTEPFSFSYNTRTQPNGAKVLTAKAYDTLNNVGTSAPVNVTFSNDLVAPTTSITSPTGGATLSGVVQIDAIASDGQGAVTKVDFYMGTTLLGTDTTAPYSWSWDTALVPTGSKTLKTRAWDEAGNSAYSPNVTVMVTR